MVKNIIFGLVIVVGVVVVFVDMKKHEIAVDRVVMYTTAYTECLKQYDCNNQMCKQTFEQLQKSVNKLK